MTSLKYLCISTCTTYSEKKRLERRVRSNWNSPVNLQQTKGEVFLWLKEKFSVAELKELTALQVHLFIQRLNEPVYKRELDQKLIEDKQRSESTGKVRR